jgi:hypothetical protein
MATRRHEKMHRAQLYITQKQNENLAFLSQETGTTSSDHMRRALDAYFSLPHVVAHLKRKPKQLELDLADAPQQPGGGQGGGQGGGRPQASYPEQR